MRIHGTLIYLLYLVHLARTLPFGSGPTFGWRRQTSMKTKRTNTGAGGGIPGAGGGIPTKRSKNAFGSLGKRFGIGGSKSGGRNLETIDGETGASSGANTQIKSKKDAMEFYTSFFSLFNEEQKTKNLKSSEAANNQSSNNSTGQIGLDAKDYSQILKNTRKILGSTKIENNSHRFKKCTEDWLKEKLLTKRKKLDLRTLLSENERSEMFKDWYLTLIRTRCYGKISL